MRTGSSPTLAHVDAIAEAIAATDAKLVVLDSFMAYMPLSVNSHKDQHIRYALGPRVELAAGARAAMLVFRHLNKAADGDPLYRAGGSIGIIGAVRSGLIPAPDPDDDGRTVLASTKANLARKADSLTFSIAVAGNGAPHTAEALLAVSTDSREDRSAIAEAADFLRSQLGGGPVAYSVLKREAAAAGIAPPTLRRATARLHVESAKCGRPGEGEQRWSWRLQADHLRASACKTGSDSRGFAEHDQTGADDRFRAEIFTFAAVIAANRSRSALRLGPGSTLASPPPATSQVAQRVGTLPMPSRFTP